MLSLAVGMGDLVDQVLVVGLYASTTLSWELPFGFPPITYRMLLTTAPATAKRAVGIDAPVVHLLVVGL